MWGFLFLDHLDLVKCGMPGEMSYFIKTELLGKETAKNTYMYALKQYS